jgi:uncharacterized protein (TIGR03437 family)
MYLRDLQHSSLNSSEARLNQQNIANLQPAWTLSVGAALAAGATVSNGVLYFGDWAGNFRAVDAKTGSVLWKAFLGKAPVPADPTCFPAIGISSQAAVLGSTVYVGGGDSAVYALDISSGQQIWRTPLADPTDGAYLWSSVMPYRNALYIGIASLGDCPTVRGGLARIDPQNPQHPLIRYLVPEGARGAGIWSTPAIDAATNTVFTATGNGDVQDIVAGNYSEAMLALDADTLAIKSYFFLPADEADQDLDWGSSPTLFTTPAGVPLVAATAKDGFLYAVRRSDLSLAWKTALAVGCVAPEEGCGSVSTPAFDGKTLFVAAGVRDPNLFFSGSVYAINPADGSVLWERDTASVLVAPVTVANGLVFASTTKGLAVYDAATGQLFWGDGGRGALYSQAVVVNGTVFSTYLSGEVVAWNLPATGNLLSSFSAASGFPGFAANGIASVYGASLNGAGVTVTDSAGTERPADVFFSSSNQINYLVPDQTELGRATLTVTASSGTKLTTPLQISAVAPGIFSANADGKGVAAAQALLVKADGTRNFLQVLQCGSATGSCVGVPIDLGADSDQVVLILYGTGLRGLSSPDKGLCTIGGLPATVLYAGSQNQFKGLDQVNVLIPKGLKGRGQVNVALSVDRQLSNTVTVNIK